MLDQFEVQDLSRPGPLNIIADGYLSDLGVDIESTSTKLASSWSRIDNHMPKISAPVMRPLYINVDIGTLIVGDKIIPWFSLAWVVRH